MEDKIVVIDGVEYVLYETYKVDIEQAEIDSWQDGYQEGHDEGYSDGYDCGYQDGERVSE